MGAFFEVMIFISIICVLTGVIVEVIMWFVDIKILSNSEMTKILKILKHNVDDFDISYDGCWDELTFGGKLPKVEKSEIPFLTRFKFSGHGRVLRFTMLHKVLVSIFNEKHKTYKKRNKRPWEV